MINPPNMVTTEIVHLPDAPLIAGLRFRLFRDANDYQQMAAVHKGSQVWDQIDPLSARESVPTAESLALRFSETEMRHHPDLLLAEIDGRVVGYNHVLW